MSELLKISDRNGAELKLRKNDVERLSIQLFRVATLIREEMDEKQVSGGMGLDFIPSYSDAHSFYTLNKELAGGELKSFSINCFYKTKKYVESLDNHGLYK